MDLSGFHFPGKSSENPCIVHRKRDQAIPIYLHKVTIIHREDLDVKN